MKKRCKDLESELATLRSSTFTSISNPMIATDKIFKYLDLEEPTQINQIESQPTTLKRIPGIYEDEDYNIDDILEELKNIVNSAESDMNTEINSVNEKASILELSVGSQTTALRSENYLTTTASQTGITPAVELGEDLRGETSDFPTIFLVEDDQKMECPIEPSFNNRNQMTRTYFGQSVPDNENPLRNKDIMEKSFSSEQDNNMFTKKHFGTSSDEAEEKIQPDILRTIPSMLFQKTWNFVEACSPLYIQESLRSKVATHDISLSRTRPLSMDNLAHVSANNSPMLTASPICGLEMVYNDRYLVDDSSSPLYREPDEMSLALNERTSMSPIDRAASLGDLNVGDLFSFQYSNRGSETKTCKGSKRSQPSEYSVHTNQIKGRQAFNFSNFIPEFLKPNSKPSRQEWQSFQMEKALMKDYRQNFHRHSGQAPSRSSTTSTYGSGSEVQFWPKSFKALPHRNIPQPTNISIRTEQKNCSAPLPSPNQLARGIQMHVNQITKLMDHPSGLY